MDESTRTPALPLGGKLTVTRWFTGSAWRPAQRSHRPWFILVDGGCYQPWRRCGGCPGSPALTARGGKEDRSSSSGPWLADDPPDAACFRTRGLVKKQPTGRRRGRRLILDFVQKTEPARQ
jgi:hypothetical protein